MKLHRLTIVALWFAVSLGSCGLMPERHEPIDVVNAGLVAKDMVAALSMLRGYAPANTTLQLRTPKTAFAVRMESALRSSGYGLQTVADNEPAPLLVTHEVKVYAQSAGNSVGYRIRVGSVELAREYELRAGRVFPMTSLSVTGVPIASEPLADQALGRDLFDYRVAESQDLRSNARTSQSPESLSGWSVVGKGAVSLPSSIERSISQRGIGKAYGATADDIAASPAPELTVQENGSALDNYVDEVEFDRTTFDNVKKQTPAFVALNGGRQNVLALGESNYAGLIRGYQVQSEETLIFADDSAFIGKRNKAALGRLADRFDPVTDLVSVLGCSHGSSRISNGNQYLAISRANRVKEALILADIPVSRILEEGCWAPTAQRNLPGRGVVVTHRRRSTG